jgi:hypothetical protein
MFLKLNTFKNYKTQKNNDDFAKANKKHIL